MRLDEALRQVRPWVDAVAAEMREPSPRVMEVGDDVVIHSLVLNSVVVQGIQRLCDHAEES